MGHAILLSRATCVIREEILRQPQVLSLVGRRFLFTSPRNHAVRTVFPMRRETRASGASLKAARNSGMQRGEIRERCTMFRRPISEFLYGSPR